MANADLPGPPLGLPRPTFYGLPLGGFWGFFEAQKAPSIKIEGSKGF